MARPLEVLEFVEQYAVIRFWLHEADKPAKIYNHITKQYGQSRMNRGNLYKWVERFKNGRTLVTDGHRYGRSIEVSTQRL